MNYYVDMHTNLLPDMQAVESRIITEAEALRRIDELRESNIKLAVAAPLYQPEHYTPAEFLALRDQKIEALADAAQPLRIVSGAVLPFAYCMEEMRALSSFTLGDSSYFLLSLPQQPITDEFCESLSRLRIVSGLYPIAVDIERYFDVWSLEDWIALRQTGMLLQISVNGLLHPEKRKLSLYLLANQYAHFVATGSREIDQPLHFTEAMRMVQRSLPAQLYRRVKNNAGMLLSNAEPAAFLSA